MSNEEKAKEIAQEHAKYTENCSVNLHLENKSKVYVARETAYTAAIEMAKWKDEQFEAEKQALIDKACEWLKDNARNYYSAYATEDRLIEDFKKYMEL